MSWDPNEQHSEPVKKTDKILDKLGSKEDVASEDDLGQKLLEALREDVDNE